MTWKCKSLGICTRYGCLRPAATGKVKCEMHLEYDRKHHAKYKKKQQNRAPGSALQKQTQKQESCT